MSGGIYLSFTGLLSKHIPFAPSVEISLTETPTEGPDSLATNVSGNPPTPDLRATEISLTLNALSTLVQTREAVSPTPDATATILACDYDYEIIRQTPENGAAYPALTSVTQRITVVNDSKCTLDDDIRLVFFEGFQLDGPDYLEFNQELRPGEEFEIVLELRTPALTNPNDPIVRSSWIIVLPDGIQVGQPLIFEFVLF